MGMATPTAMPKIIRIASTPFCTALIKAAVLKDLILMMAKSNRYSKTPGIRGMTAGVAMTWVGARK